MRSVVFQSSFVSGEIDPVLYDRTDLKQTSSAARSLLNWRVLPQGGIAKREGTQYLATVSDSPVDTKLVGWTYSVDESYLVVFVPGAVKIFDVNAGAFVASITNTIWLSADDLALMRHRQILDTMFVVQEWYKPQRILKLAGYSSGQFATVSGSNLVTVTRKFHGLSNGDMIVFASSTTVGGVTISSASTYTVSAVTDNTFKITLASNASSTTTGGSSSLVSWCISSVKLTNVPRVDFSDELSPAASLNQIQRITFVESNNAGVWVPKLTTNATSDSGLAYGVGNGFKFSFNGYNGDIEAPWVVKTDGTPNWDIMIPWIKNALLGPVGNGTLNNFNVLTPVQGTGDVGVGRDSAGQAYVLIEMIGKWAKQELAAIRGIVTGVKPLPLLAVTIEQDPDQKLEDAWSNTRGWPKAVEFFENRLCFGGSTSQPNAFWASVSANYGDFDLGDAHDDEAISRDIDGSSGDGVEHLIGLRSLMVMTSRGEYYQTETPMTPESCTFKQQTSHGSKNVPPAKVDGSVYFVQRNGGAIRRLLYNFQEDSYAADEVTILARHLFKDYKPASIAAVAHPKDGDYLYVALEDGKMAILSVDRSQAVAGWTSWRTTQGRVKSIAAVNDNVYMIVDRYQTSTEGKVCLEVISTGAPLDCQYDVGVTGSPGTVTASGLGWLDKSGTTAASGVIARIDFSDGSAPLIDGNPQIISGVYSKTLTGDYAGKSATRVRIGYRITSTFTPLPVPFDVGMGNMMVRRKRVSRITLDCQETEVGAGGFGVGSYSLTQAKVFGESTPLSTSSMIDGQVSIPILGWSRMPSVGDALQTVTHSYPGTCTIKSIEREVDVTGHLGEEK